MIIPLNQSLIDFNEWKELYSKARNKEIESEHYGYGIKIDAKHLKKEINLPLKPYFFFLVSNKRKREFPIHVDGIPGQQAASLNWAISGCNDKSPTNFYECCTDIVWKDLDNSFFLENTQDAVKTHSVTMYDNNVYLFRSDLLHSGYCNLDTTETRIIVKWELEYDSWSTACREFRNRNYI